MTVYFVSLKNFRNFSDQTVTFGPGVNVLLGDNAQGKTNIIEALWLFSTCRSFRTGDEKVFLKFGEHTGGVEVAFQKGERNQKAAIRFYEDKRKDLFLNNIVVRPSELVGTFPSVLFFPDHLSLVKGSPEGRRKFLDLAICQVKPRFLSVLAEYNRVLKQRSALLRAQRLDINEQLDVWDEKAARLSALIAITRRSYIKRMEPAAADTAIQISGGAETLTLQYESVVTDTMTELNRVEDEFFYRLKENRQKDLQQGRTTVGAHRDDLGIFINNRDARYFASQGQQRSCVMALKLAEAQLLQEETGESPLMLFDDVFSELDPARREYIVSRMGNRQVILSSCEGVADFGNARQFRVKNGIVLEESL